MSGIIVVCTDYLAKIHMFDFHPGHVLAKMFEMLLGAAGTSRFSAVLDTVEANQRAITGFTNEMYLI